MPIIPKISAPAPISTTAPTSEDSDFEFISQPAYVISDDEFEDDQAPASLQANAGSNTSSVMTEAKIMPMAESKEIAFDTKSILGNLAALNGVNLPLKPIITMDSDASLFMKDLFTKEKLGKAMLFDHEQREQQERMWLMNELLRMSTEHNRLFDNGFLERLRQRDALATKEIVLVDDKVNPGQTGFTMRKSSDSK